MGGMGGWGGCLLTYQMSVCREANRLAERRRHGGAHQESDQTGGGGHLVTASLRALWPSVSREDERQSLVETTHSFNLINPRLIGEPVDFP